MHQESNIILAKPSGITLEQHVSNVVSEANIILSNVPFVPLKYSDIVCKDLQKRLEIVCKVHDDGKKHPKWQNACQLDYKVFLAQKEKGGQANPSGTNIM